MKRSVVIASAALAATVLTPTANALAHTEAAPVSDLDLTVRGTESMNAGGPLTYQLEIHNKGPDAADAVSFEASHDVGMRLSEPQGTKDCGWILGPGKYGVFCSLKDPIPSGGTKVIELNGSIQPHTAGELVLNVTVKSKGDPDLSGNSRSLKTHVIAGADLNLAQTGPSTARRGDAVTYDATVSDHGGTTAKGAKYSLRLPAGITYSAVSVTQGRATCTAQPSEVTCDLGDVYVSSAPRIKITAKVGKDVSVGARLQATATAQSPVADPITANNQVKVDTTVVSLPPAPTKADVVVSGKASALRKGRTGTYAIVVTNKGPNAAKNVVVTGALPKGMTFKSVRGCKRYKNGIKCTIPSLKAGGKVTITLNVMVVKGAKSGARTFVVIARSATKDPVPANNAARIKRSITK